MATDSRAEPGHDILRTHRWPLNCVFEPTSVAVIGASEKSPSVGRTVLNNLLQGSYSGKIFPVNPNYTTVMGLPALPNIAAVKEPVDLAVIATKCRAEQAA